MSKRKFFVLLLFPFFISCNQFSKEDFKSFYAMNTFMSVKTYGKNSKIANEQIFQKITELENLFSTTRTESEVFKLNHSDGKKLKLSDSTFFLLNYGVEKAKIFDGHFNPFLFPVIQEWGFTTGEYKIPSKSQIFLLLNNTDFEKVQFFDDNSVKFQKNMMVDFGSLAKGFATDECVKILKANNIESAILDFGGNIFAYGKKPDSSAWRIGIKNPFADDIQIALNICDKAVVTSGGYERFFIGDDGTKYIHIFDGKTGYPVQNEIASITIISENALYADCLSTSLFILGEEKAKNYWKSHQDFEMLIIKTDKSIYYTPPLKNSLRTD